MQHLSPTIVLGRGVARTAGPLPDVHLRAVRWRSSVPSHRFRVPLCLPPAMQQPRHSVQAAGRACHKTPAHRTFWHHMTLWGYTAVVHSPAVNLCIRSSGRAVSAATAASRCPGCRQGGQKTCAASLLLPLVQRPLWVAWLPLLGVVYTFC